jgi:leucyl aminopeptidase (aminopeptidase T)
MYLLHVFSYMQIENETLTRKAVRNILEKNIKVKKNENVIVETWSHTLPLASVFVDEARRLGARTLVHYEDEDAFWNTIERGQAKLLGALSDPEWAALEKADVYIFIWGPEDRPRWAGFSGKVWEDVIAYNEQWYKVAKKAGIRGARIEIGRATKPAAKKLGVDLSEWRAELLKACTVDPDRMMKYGKKLASVLANGKSIHIHHPNGTDLDLKLKGFKPRIYAGMFTKENMASPFGTLLNLPAGQVAVALDDTRGEGKLVANRPSYMEDGKVSGAKWAIHDGKLAEARFSDGGDVFQRPFKKAKKGKDSVSFLYLGINPEIHEAPNMEDTESGAVLVGVGRNNFLGGTNSSDFFGWAVVADCEVSVDGKPIIRGGRIL